MRLREWLDVEIDKASIRHEADGSVKSAFDVHQAALASLYYAVQLIDARVEELERRAGITPPDLRAR